VNLVVKTARIVRAEPEADPLGALVRAELLEEIIMPPKRKRKTVRIPVAPSRASRRSTTRANSRVSRGAGGGSTPPATDEPGASGQQQTVDLEDLHATVDRLVQEALRSGQPEAEPPRPSKL
jgi:hypothetical protein